MKCKNCVHQLVVDGEDGSDVSHRTRGDGTAVKCSFCDCEKPERIRPSTLCKNCGCEIKRRKGEWWHVHLYTTSAGGIPRYVGVATRELVKTCFHHNCENPEKLTVIRHGTRYKFAKDWAYQAPPLEWHGKKGEVVVADYPSLGHARFYSTKDRRLIIMSAKEAFENLVEERK